MFGWSSSTPEETWDHNVPLWLASGCVLGGAICPNFGVSKEHKLCERFANKHPDATNFLLGKLSDPNPILAAYAFKCLIRVADLDYANLPTDVANRTETIDVQQAGCIRETKTLRQFLRNYYDIDDPDDDFENLPLPEESMTDAKPDSKFRLFRFSLKTLLLFMLASGVLVGILIPKLMPSQSMDARIPFDSPIWREDSYAVTALATLKSWRQDKPTVNEFKLFIESHTCSEYNYRSFFYILPYVLDELESRPASQQFKMVSILDWKLLKSQEGILPDRCYDQLSDCQHRIIEILTAINDKPGCPPKVIQYNLGAIAAMRDDYELGEQLMSRGDDI